MLNELGCEREVRLSLNEKQFLTPRELVDLSEVDLSIIDESHEAAIRINHMEDDKVWYF